MQKIKLLLAAGSFLPMWLPLQAQEVTEQLPTQHADCALFGPERAKYMNTQKGRVSMSAMTENVTNQIQGGAFRMKSAFVPSDTRTSDTIQLAQMGTIDRNVYGVLQDKGVAPARKPRA